MKLIYTVFSADPVRVTRRVVVDGMEVEASVAGLSVQLVADDHGTINLNLSEAQAAGHPFTVGSNVTVSFEAAK